MGVKQIKTVVCRAALALLLGIGCTACVRAETPYAVWKGWGRVPVRENVCRQETGSAADRLSPSLAAWSRKLMGSEPQAVYSIVVKDNCSFYYARLYTYEFAAPHGSPVNLLQQWGKQWQHRMDGAGYMTVPLHICRQQGLWLEGKVLYPAVAEGTDIQDAGYILARADGKCIRAIFLYVPEGYAPQAAKTILSMLKQGKE